MDKEKDMKAVNKETTDFLEGLPPAELGRVLNTPEFTGVVLKSAVQSARVAQNVDEVLDAEFQQMSPEQQDRINRLADKLRQELAPEQAQSGWLTRQWRIIAAGARQFGGPEPALVLGAHQQSEPGWPFKLALTIDRPSAETRLEFQLWGVDLVVKNISDPNAPIVLIQVKSTSKAVTLQPGEKQSLGDIEDYGLTDTSDKESIAKALGGKLKIATPTA